MSESPAAIQRLYGSRAMGNQWAGSDIELLPTPSPFDVTHWESLRYPGLREHMKRVGKAVPTWANHHSR
jgi:predicted nucleotidyltransferase